MNSKAKGNRNRLRAKRLLEEQGYLVDIVEKSGKFCKDRDCFGIADLISIKPDEIILVQVCSNRPHTHSKYEEFAKKYPCVKVMQIVWIDRVKEPRIILY